MRDPLECVKPAVRALSAYKLAARTAVVKINQNENPFELPDSLKLEVLEAARQRPWGRYPAFDPRELRAALAEFAGWREDGVIAGNGSNELIQALLMVTVGPGTRVVIPEPTFTLYALLTGVLGGEAVRVRLGADLQYDAPSLVTAAIESGATLTIVCSPNNPSGTLLDAAGVETLCRETPGLVVIDEAYHEFAGTTVVPLLDRHPNLVVLRTFSKAMAMAGLRVGYLLASPALVREIDKARLPYNLNVFSETAAMTALRHRPVLEASVLRLQRLRDDLMGALDTLPGAKVHRSHANFFLLELRDADPKVVFEALYAKGILVRDVTSYPGLERCLRISVGSDDENAALVGALQEALATVWGNEELMRARKAEVRRKTKETDITLALNLDGEGKSRIATGVGFLDHMVTSLATHARFDLQVRAKGDLHVDAHHTVEDVGIALGDALLQALGDKKGIVRFGHAYVPLDEALSRCVIDLSGRPWLHFGVEFKARQVGAMPTELFEDFFWALADHGRLNLHLDNLRGRNAHHIAETLFKCTARALRMAVAFDPRVKDVPSTKGSL